MSPQELFRAGKLAEAIQALGGQLRNNPSSAKDRTFLFELLCFTGDYSRAEKHLSLLADTSPDAGVGALLFRSALSAERKRQAFFEAGEYGKSPAAEVVARPGKLNGEPFQTIEDADSRIGARFEVFIAGEYIWLPMAHIGTLTLRPPKLLRDTLWPSALIAAGPALKGQDFGEVLLPVLYPFSWRHEKDSVKLGRETEWESKDGAADIPFGQKLLVVDGGERVVPYLEIRSLLFDDAVAPMSVEEDATGSTSDTAPEPETA